MRTVFDDIARALTPLNVVVLENADGNPLTRVAGTHVVFFSYGYPLLAPVESVEGVALAGELDYGPCWTEKTFPAPVPAGRTISSPRCLAVNKKVVVHKL